jgi:N-acetylglucosaminyl-diphospho-decaprenol L-rhamnosyltransferase
MKTGIKLSVIIVNYNTGALTKECVESLLKQETSFNIEIIVVDNASSDESVSFLRSDYPEIKVIESKKNLGLAGGVNFGIEEARGKYYLVLNPDIVVLPGALKYMIEWLDKNNDVGMIGGQLVSPNGRIQNSCYRFYTPMTIIYRRTWLGKTKKGVKAVRRFLMKDYDHRVVKDVDWLMGACLMVRAEVVDQIGGMDDKFFLYFEDVDWCRRVWGAGWRVVYVPEAKFSHYHQRSSEKSGVLSLITNWIVREHIKSAIKYFWKYRNTQSPRLF